MLNFFAIIIYPFFHFNLFKAELPERRLLQVTTTLSSVEAELISSSSYSPSPPLSGCCAYSALGRKCRAVDLVRCKKHDLETLQKNPTKIPHNNLKRSQMDDKLDLTNFLSVSFKVPLCYCCFLLLAEVLSVFLTLPSVCGLRDTRHARSLRSVAPLPVGRLGHSSSSDFLLFYSRFSLPSFVFNCMKVTDEWRHSETLITQPLRIFFTKLSN